MSRLSADQRAHWNQTYGAHPGMYGTEPSVPAVHAATIFRPGGEILELGAGHGRDALFFAQRGFRVRASDFSAEGLEQLDVAAAGLPVRTFVHDVREPLPLPDASVDGVFAHMLLCMALTTGQIRALTHEVARVLRPGGAFVYTVRHVGDAHFGIGTDHGDNIYETGGFAVHFFDRGLVDDLAGGWNLIEITDLTEGELPRRLWRVTLHKPDDVDFTARAAR